MKKIAVMIITLGLAGAAAAQQPNADQVGLVIPAFGEELGEPVAFVLKSAIQRQLSSEDPDTGVRGIGRGITYFVPDQMAKPSHGSAVRLAQLNGMQGTLWGAAAELIDGVAYTAFLTLSPPYQDFRSVRREFWTIEVEGQELRLAPPQMRIAFRPEVFTEEVVRAFGAPDGLLHCPLEGGPCITFPTYQISRLREMRGEGVVIRRGSVDYIVKLPTQALLDSDIVAYSALFLAYARGNLNDARRLAGHFVEASDSTELRVDAHLYRAAVEARLGRHESARSEIEAALVLSPAAARALRYAIMVELSAARAVNARAREYAHVFQANYLPSSEFDKRMLALIKP